ncbi:ABC transporter ATP-binding protein [Liquorilactobacillus oeni]|uniref:Nodulation ATP-binding protein I family protein n=1 Tax=Liquorilactobacillus oeni DSM 19972 TaxID=1423777 RepID=A0A0R1M8C3_9LACO|nr:ABC transporter ATP-binding protein [Liquorilactobacillus oeni]KRL04464.1 nodulation ATP-binding protein I family protein [Liquorilactobacillus oeni DSM 19972]
MSTVIKASNLVQGYGKTIVLKQVNLEIKKGEILALIGPSGSGKTTLINSIMGMINPQKGEVTLLDTRMPNRKILSNIGFMAQTDALYWTMTARENLAFFGIMQGVPKKQLKKRISYAAAVVNLEPSLNKQVQYFSGGMKRRLSLAIALVADPQILILDEPTVGIDPELRQQIWKELHHLASEGKTILLTTHVMNDAWEADNLFLIRKGEAIAQGTPRTLIKKYEVQTIEEVFLKAGRLQDAHTSND